MAKFTFIILTLMVIACTMAIPAGKEALDKVRAEDEAFNSVTSDKKPSDVSESPKDKDTEASSNFDSSTKIIEIYEAPPVVHKPRTPGTAVARIIDDIFQIPISVLQSVARLLRNPFVSHKTPETVSSY